MTDHNCGQLGEFLKRFWWSWDSEAQKCVDCEAENLKKNWISAACRWFLFPLSTCMSGRLALWDLTFRDASALPSLCDPLLSSQVGHEEFPSPKKWWSVHCQSREHPHIFTPFYTSMCLQTFGAQVWSSYIQWNKENQWIGVSPVFSITARTAHPGNETNYQMLQARTCDFTESPSGPEVKPQLPVGNVWRQDCLGRVAGIEQSINVNGFHSNLLKIPRADDTMHLKGHVYHHSTHLSIVFGSMCMRLCLCLYIYVALQKCIHIHIYNISWFFFASDKCVVDLYLNCISYLYIYT